MPDFFLLLLFASPAAVANMMPIVAHHFSWMKFCNVPLDGGWHFRGRRILGDHKTIRGFLVGTLFSTLWGGVLFLFAPFFPLAPRLEVFLLFGFLAGFGALSGDAIKSFFKRQCGIPSGRPFLPFDQTDYIFGFLLFTFPLVPWTATQAGILLLSALLLNPLVNTLSFVVGIKKTFW